MALISLRKFIVNRHRVRRISWGALVAAVTVMCSVALWQIALAQQQHQTRLVTPTLGAAAPPERNIGPRQDGERLPPYDLAAVNDDTTYYQRADASRIRQMAPIPPGQKRHEEILIVGAPFRLVLPHRWLAEPLVVRAKPGRPVTFLALDSGKFTNDANTITVRADEQGFAAARFSVTNEGYYRVLAASPENSGPAEFAMQCVTEKFHDDVESGRHAKQYQAKQRAAEERRVKAAEELAERVRRHRSVKK